MGNETWFELYILTQSKIQIYPSVTSLKDTNSKCSKTESVKKVQETVVTKSSLHMLE
jgi:hypothetical protein